VNFGSLEDALMAVRELLSKSVMHPVSNVLPVTKERCRQRIPE
jgi:hypothetical protein